MLFFFSSRRRHTRWNCDWSSDVCSSDLAEEIVDDSNKDKPASRREVVLISDLQEGARLDGLQGHDWPAGVKVTLERIDARRRRSEERRVGKECRTRWSAVHQNENLDNQA